MTETKQREQVPKLPLKETLRAISKLYPLLALLLAARALSQILFLTPALKGHAYFAFSIEGLEIAIEFLLQAMLILAIQTNQGRSWSSLPRLAGKAFEMRGSLLYFYFGFTGWALVALVPTAGISFLPYLLIKKHLTFKEYSHYSFVISLTLGYAFVSARLFVALAAILSTGRDNQFAFSLSRKLMRPHFWKLFGMHVMWMAPVVTLGSVAHAAAEKGLIGRSYLMSSGQSLYYLSGEVFMVSLAAVLFRELKISAEKN